MDTYDTLFSPGYVLNEQIARQIFEIVPDCGPIVVIVDVDGHCWPSDSERFGELNISGQFLKQMCSQIDDGSEPLVTQVNGCSIVAVQLATERTNCGYVIIALPGRDPESTLANVELIEMLLNQISLIAKLIERNNLLYELQMKHYSVYGQGETASN